MKVGDRGRAWMQGVPGGFGYVGGSTFPASNW